MDDTNVATLDDTALDDTAELTRLNDHFIEACRQGSWELLSQILSDDFAYLDGNTGEVLTREPYAQALGPAPTLTIDQVVVHVDGDTAIVSARSSANPGRYSRYIDTYARREHGWVCVHACVWRGLEKLG